MRRNVCGTPVARMWSSSAVLAPSVNVEAMLGVDVGEVDEVLDARVDGGVDGRLVLLDAVGGLVRGIRNSVRMPSSAAVISSRAP